jgi:hypothetical protein
MNAMNGLNITGLLVSAVGSGLFIWHDVRERRRYWKGIKVLEAARLKVREDEKALTEYEASLRQTLQATRPIPTGVTNAARHAAETARAREEERFRDLAKTLKNNVKESRARLDELTKPEPDKAEIESLPPRSHIAGATLLVIGFLFQLAGEIFEP